MNHYGIEDCAGPLFAQPAPAVRGSVTSAAAADSLTPATLNALQKRVLDFIARRPSGATDEEIANELEMNPSTVRPRRIELARRGMIVESGSTRRTASGRMAVVWKVTAASR
jgi:transcription initiation factor IIE alpha subunit